MPYLRSIRHPSTRDRCLKSASCGNQALRRKRFLVDWGGLEPPASGSGLGGALSCVRGRHSTTELPALPLRGSSELVLMLSGDEADVNNFASEHIGKLFDDLFVTYNARCDPAHKLV